MIAEGYEISEISPFAYDQATVFQSLEQWSSHSLKLEGIREVLNSSGEGNGHWLPR